MKRRPPIYKVAQENTTQKSRSQDRNRFVNFKKRTFEFKQSTIEQKSKKFNEAISLASPNNKEMYLFVDKFSWTPSKALLDAAIKISVSYPDGKSDVLYNSKTVSQLALGIRNVNLSYSIKEAGVVTVNFECARYDPACPDYTFVYKWLDPQKAKVTKVPTSL
ncbi:MAG TPA: hypothetical protein VNY36_07890 [Bacteroidia bacterium]|jgi:hypothetical protein|nr:hypothetical protein [Bacteroidia bacterium]